MADEFQVTEPLTTPIERNLRADRVEPTQLLVRADKKQVMVVFKKGITNAEGFHSVFPDNYAFEDTVDEEGQPDKTEYTDLMQAHTICAYCQGRDVSNAHVLRMLAIHYLKQVEAI